MIIQENIIATLNGCTIYVKNGTSLISMVSIPPTNVDRIDVILETKKELQGGILKTHTYLYNYKENIKKLKGEKILIKIKKGKPSITYLKK